MLVAHAVHAFNSRIKQTHTADVVEPGDTVEFVIRDDCSNLLGLLAVLCKLCNDSRHLQNLINRFDLYDNRRKGKDSHWVN